MLSASLNKILSSFLPSNISNFHIVHVLVINLDFVPYVSVYKWRKEMFYLTTHSTHFIHGYMASDIWQRTTQIAKKETRCRHMGYTFRLAARVLLHASSHRQDSTYHGLCYNSPGTLAGTRNNSKGPPHEGSIRRPIAPWANALTTDLHLAPSVYQRLDY